MAKAPSADTQLRTLKAQAKDLNKQLDAALVQRDAYRARATKAEQEAADWKQRFDILLRRDGKEVSHV